MMLRRKTSVALLVAIALLAGMAQALPSIWGLRGLYQVVDARTPPPGSYSVSVVSKYQYAGVSDTVRLQPPEYPEVDTLLDVYDAEHYLDATVLVNVGIRDFLEVGISATYIANVYQYDRDPPRDQYVGYVDGVHGLGDIRVSGKYSRLMLPWLTAGGALWLAYPPGQNKVDIASDYDGFWDQDDCRLQTRRPFLHTGGFSWGLMALATAVQHPLEGHLNLGISGYNQTWDDPVVGTMNESDIAIDLGIGAALPSRNATVFLEYTAKFFTGRGNQPGYRSPMRLVGGLRLYQDSGAFFDLAGMIGLSGHHDRRLADPYVTGILPVPGGLDGEFGVVFSFGYDTSLFGQDGSGGRGTVCGTVSSSDTGEPIDATITFPDGSGVDAQSAGGYFCLPVESGPVVVRVEAEGYRPYVTTIVIPEGETWPLDFRLEKAGPETGTVAGTVRSMSTGSPVSGQVTISELPDVSAGVSSSDGAFRMDVPEGTWTVKVDSPGYLAASSVTQVTAGQTSVVDFSLRDALTQGTVLSFANIYFDSGSANIKPESYGVLDEIADLLMVNSTVRVEIAGHTDSDGSESYNRTLSERRAASVRDYLVQHGIASSRMTTIGHGESQPVASNDTAAGKSQNRRIEFRIL
jgi:outer membrane protein OmpA-like peptidoglycan-associated protein